MSDQTTFAGYLITLGQHLLLKPDLPAIANVNESYYYKDRFHRGLQIQLSSENPAALAAWAGTLADVSSRASRLKSGAMYGYVYGRVGDVAVCVWMGNCFDTETFPSHEGDHEWDVHVLLQEA